MELVFREPILLLLSIPVYSLILYVYLHVRRNRRILSKTLGFREDFSMRIFDYIKILLPVLILLALAGLSVMNTVEIKVTTPIDLSKYSGKLPLQYILMVDVSPSMHRGDNLQVAIESLKTILERLNTSDRVVIAVFGGRIEKIYNGSPVNAFKYLDDIMDREIKYTSIDYAVSWAATYSRAVRIPSAIIVISDGADNYGGDPVETVKAVNESGIPIAFIKIGNDPRGLKLYSRLASLGFRVVEPGSLDKETLRDIMEKMMLKLKYEAYSARGEITIREVYYDDTPTRILILASILSLVLSRIEGR